MKFNTVFLSLQPQVKPLNGSNLPSKALFGSLFSEHMAKFALTIRSKQHGCLSSFPVSDPINHDKKIALQSNPSLSAYCI